MENNYNANKKPVRSEDKSSPFQKITPIYFHNTKGTSF